MACGYEGGGTVSYLTPAMPREHQHNPDSNANAARIVGESTKTTDTLPQDAEAAWLEWSSRVQNVDERTRSLLRAAFEAGYYSGLEQK